MTAKMLYVHALSPIHSGTGQSADVIDLPVAREKVTNWPYLPGSSLKGVLRDAAANAPGSDPARITAAFGPDTQHAADHAGALWFTDARLLCFPVRSLAGSFAWVTSPLALRRWLRDHESAGIAPTPVLPTTFTESLPIPGATDGRRRPVITLAPNAAALVRNDLVYLEDLDLAVTRSTEAGTLATTIAAAVFDDPAWHAFFSERFGIVSDTLLTFLAETATDVFARVRLDDDSKTVAQGGLWYEEAVPAEAIFACPVIASRVTNGCAEDELFAAVGAGMAGAVQVGGHASIGRGLVAARFR